MKVKSLSMEHFFNLQNKLVFNRKDDVFGRFDDIVKVSSLNLVAFTSENCN